LTIHISQIPQEVDDFRRIPSVVGKNPERIVPARSISEASANASVRPTGESETFILAVQAHARDGYLLVLTVLNRS
jgi:hypothetical protein